MGSNFPTPSPPTLLPGILLRRKMKFFVDTANLKEIAKRRVWAYSTA